MDLLIASRRSDLARLQAYQVGEALKIKNPGLKINYHFRESMGDQNLNDPLWKMPEKGVFTEDFREGLIKKEWDMVVHSFKDLPIETTPQTQVVATLPRADSRDLLILKKNHFQKVEEKKVLTLYSSSPRRVYNLKPFLKDYFPTPLDDVQFENVRGNILTRIEKLFSHDSVDGLILAKAALDRILSTTQDEFKEGRDKIKNLLFQCYWQVLPLSLNPTAAGQGALAVEISSDRTDLKELLKTIHCQKTWDDVDFERSTLKKHGGGCHQKIGVSRFHRSYGSVSFLKGQKESGEILNEDHFNPIKPLKLKNPYLEMPTWFERESVLYQYPTLANAHFIARETALPKDVKISKDQILWVSGLKTWKALARRGLWVNGCSDSLGESEERGLGILAPDLKWAKWTHKEGYFQTQELTVSTYQLKAKNPWIPLKAYSEFYWTSGSQFLLAISRQPEILKAEHYCGAGHTYTIIKDMLNKNGISKEPTIVPHFSLWKAAFKGS